MAFEIRPAHSFEDVATILGPRNPDSTVCWCLSYRISAPHSQRLLGRERADFVRSLCERELAPGVLAYDGDTVVGWAGVAPRSELHAFISGRTIPHVDDLPVWSVWCFRVRGGHRGRGIARALLDGAVEYARASGAPAIEGYPIDNGGVRVDLTSAFVGTRSLFEAAGFTFAAKTNSSRAGYPRVVMRRLLGETSLQW